MGKISILAVIVGGIVDFVMTITLLAVLTFALSVGHRKITVGYIATPLTGALGGWLAQRTHA